MDFGTSITKPIEFPDQEASDVTSIVRYDRDASDRSSPVRAESLSDPATANVLPESILGSWSRIAQANMTVRMYADLVRIAMQPNGWRGPASLGLRPASLNSFLEFWSTIRDGASEPELALAPDGSLYAEWFKSTRQRLDIRFLDRKVIFGLFANNDILEGAQQPSLVVQILRAHPAKPLQWSAR